MQFDFLMTMTSRSILHLLRDRAIEKRGDPKESTKEGMAMKITSLLFGQMAEVEGFAIVAQIRDALRESRSEC
jgi:hypothetical protein